MIFSEMLGPAHVLLCGVTVVVGQVGIKVFLNLLLNRERNMILLMNSGAIISIIRD